MSSMRDLWSKITNCIKERFNDGRSQRMEGIDEEFQDLNLEDLVRIKTVAEGKFGKIELVHIKYQLRQCYALKKMKKSGLTESYDRINVFNEKALLSSLKSDFIVRYHRTFQDRKHLYILMECLQGGDLYDKVPCGEAGSRFYVACLTEALEYLHARHIVHRDLKLENLALDSHGYLKVIDFGMAKRLEENNGKTYTFCGTPQYCAPEVLGHYIAGYDVAVDLWAMGLIAYEFLFMINPMNMRDSEKMKRMIMRGLDRTRFPKDAPEDAMSFIRGLCRLAPYERLGYGPGGFHKLRNHCWMGDFDWHALREKILPPPLIPTLTDGAADTSNFTQSLNTVEEDEDEDVDEDRYGPNYDPDWAKDF